ncbi:hypothetical protein ACWEO4_42590 [Streptomyces sp. NPDC004393]|uniref:hypothetical protein n=1 Tax=Streptomyces sp. NPDC004533 TaxID=3154278 RepID=UPI0033BC42DA
MDTSINVDRQEAAVICGGLWTLSGGKDIQDCIENPALGECAFAPMVVIPGVGELKAAKKVEEGVEGVAEASRVSRTVDGWLPQDAVDKVPDSLRPFMKENKKGVDYRWNDGKGNGVRIDQGNPNNSQVFQQVDHVVINSGGKIIGRDGKPIVGSIKNHAEEAHIPLEEWLRWQEWDKP